MESVEINFKLILRAETRATTHDETMHAINIVPSESAPYAAEASVLAHPGAAPCA